ncbi:MAG: Bifunctional homocysteine S-methyltransferase/5,10-methylenetetrahydrofolate reductase [Chloroflexi bacterium ADurb.Bin325]|nr:MAG: Bifunctional homocysteine S-methyltransferase/5,10-methylenetetrahydrofolate reductase [Chloroflexi bacterium ADurb.Bin325]
MDRLIDFMQAHAVVIGDGAMGTMLQAAGLTTGGAPEAWNVARPDVVKGIYQGYAAAGSQIITTNSFGGTRYRLGREQLEAHVHEYNVAAARLAREVADAADHEVLVAGSMGPTGEIMEPLGALTPEGARAAFAEQAAALAEGGVDFFLIETMSALDEVEAAVEGIRSASDLPIAVTMTFDTRFRTMMGVKPVQAVRALYDLGVRVIGANCGNGPAEIERVISEMVEARPDGVFLIAQSNAGLPRYVDKQIHYDGTPEVMADYAAKMKALGVSYIGACCGSTPTHIAAMKRALAG